MAEGDHIYYKINCRLENNTDFATNTFYQKVNIFFLKREAKTKEAESGKLKIPIKF